MCGAPFEPKGTGTKDDPMKGDDWDLSPMILGMAMANILGEPDTPFRIKETIRHDRPDGQADMIDIVMESGNTYRVDIKRL